MRLLVRLHLALQERSVRSSRWALPRRHARHSRRGCLDDLQQAAADDDKQEEACARGRRESANCGSGCEAAPTLPRSDADARARSRRAARRNAGAAERTKHGRAHGERALGSRGGLRHVAAAQHWRVAEWRSRWSAQAQVCRRVQACRERKRAAIPIAGTHRCGGTCPSSRLRHRDTTHAAVRCSARSLHRTRRAARRRGACALHWGLGASLRLAGALAAQHAARRRNTHASARSQTRARTPERASRVQGVLQRHQAVRDAAATRQARAHAGTHA